jgi:hypothetical protein
MLAANEGLQVSELFAYQPKCGAGEFLDGEPGSGARYAKIDQLTLAGHHPENGSRRHWAGGHQQIVLGHVLANYLLKLT